METDEGDAIDGVLDGGRVFWLAGTRAGVERIADDVEMKMVREVDDGRVVFFFLGATRTVFRTIREKRNVWCERLTYFELRTRGKERQVKMTNLNFLPFMFRRDSFTTSGYWVPPAPRSRGLTTPFPPGFDGAM